MFFPGIATADITSGGNMRPFLFALLVLAILFLLAGAIIAVVALRRQRREGQHGIYLEQLENESH
jgi:hypothetical protein